MKKNILMMAAMALVGFSFSSCEDNTDPKAQIPEQNQQFLNTPALANNTYVLNQTDGVEFTCSQPDFGGVATIPTYAVQVSLSPDFNSVPDEWKYTGSASTPQNYIQLPSTYTRTSFTVPSREIADAINGCRGYNDKAQLSEPGYRDYKGAVYVRLYAYFATASADVQEKYGVYSKPVELKSVICYPTVRQPGFIYLVGAPEGWVGPDEANAAHYEDWKLYEADDQIGSQIYRATFDIPAGKFQFRFYTALAGWEFNSVGSQNEDNPVNIALKDDIYNGICVVGVKKGEGKGSWMIPDWAGGEVSMVVNLKAKTVEFKLVK